MYLCYSGILQGVLSLLLLIYTSIISQKFLCILNIMLPILLSQIWPFVSSLAQLALEFSFISTILDNCCNFLFVWFTHFLSYFLYSSIEIWSSFVLCVSLFHPRITCFAKKIPFFSLLKHCLFRKWCRGKVSCVCVTISFI